MTAITHVSAGAAIGSFMPHPALSVAAGFLSHLVLDFIPHWDPQVIPPKQAGFRKILGPILLVIDLSAAALILVLLMPYPTMFWGGLIGGIVDLDNLIHLLSRLGINVHVAGSKWHNSSSFLVGLITHGVTTLIAWYTLYVTIFSYQ